MSVKRAPQQWVAGCAGTAFLVVSAPFVIAMIHDVIVGADNLVGALVAGTFFALLACVGVGMMWFGFRPARAPEFRITPDVERRVLSIARDHQGRLTVSELAIDTQLSIDQCEAVLRHLEHRDLARTHISSGGDIVYVFPHFDDDLDKGSAIDPLSDEVLFDDLDDEVDEVSARAAVTSDEKS